MDIILGCGAQVRILRELSGYQACEVVYPKGVETLRCIGKTVKTMSEVLDLLCWFALTTYEQLTLAEIKVVLEDTMQKVLVYHQCHSEYLADRFCADD